MPYEGDLRACQRAVSGIPDGSSVMKRACKSVLILVPLWSAGREDRSVRKRSPNFRQDDELAGRFSPVLIAVRGEADERAMLRRRGRRESTKVPPQIREGRVFVYVCVCSVVHA